MLEDRGGVQKGLDRQRGGAFEEFRAHQRVAQGRRDDRERPVEPLHQDPAACKPRHRHANVHDGHPEHARDRVGRHPRSSTHREAGEDRDGALADHALQRSTDVPEEGARGDDLAHTFAEAEQRERHRETRQPSCLVQDLVDQLVRAGDSAVLDHLRNLRAGELLQLPDRRTAYAQCRGYRVRLAGPRVGQNPELGTKLGPEMPKPDQEVRVEVGVIDHHRRWLFRPERSGDPPHVRIDDEKPLATEGELPEKERLPGARLARQHQVSLGLPQPSQVVFTTDQRRRRERTAREGVYGQRGRIACEPQQLAAPPRRVIEQFCEGVLGMDLSNREPQLVGSFLQVPPAAGGKVPRGRDHHGPAGAARAQV